ncbi:MAG: hypothetical protein Q9N34_02495 [Aquificota bacterium]|nr:hypothetical protein [Aquificota bacterium]
MTTYRDAGVDIDRANEFVRYIKEKVKRNFPLGYLQTSEASPAVLS